MNLQQCKPSIVISYFCWGQPPPLPSSYSQNTGQPAAPPSSQQTEPNPATIHLLTISRYKV